MTKRIVVTGIGATSALGGTVQDNWKNLLAGTPGAHTLIRVDRAVSDPGDVRR